jgi:hypothetical protein
MIQSTDLFDMATIAEAAYADFLSADGSSMLLQGELLSARLQDFDANVSNGSIGFSETQANEFSKRYRVIHQQANTESGFSGTLFERLNSNGVPTGLGLELTRSGGRFLV